MPLTQIIKPKIEPQLITFHVDDIRPDSYTRVEKNAGFTYPVIKFRNTVIHHAQINRLTLNVGDNFLPKLTAVFRDGTQNFIDNDYPIEDDVITILLGNMADTTNLPIHADFKVLSCMVNKDTKVITISGELHVPEFKNSAIRGFGKMSNFEIIKELCNLLQIGLISNKQNSNDKNTNNQYGSTNYAYLKTLCDTIFSSEEDRYWCFIDAHYNLNVIELNSMFKDAETSETINYHLATGEPLEEPEALLLTNNQFDEIHTQFRIASWSPVNNVGQVKNSSPTAIKHFVTLKDYAKKEISTIEHDNFIQDESAGNVIDVQSSYEDASSFASSVITIGEIDDRFKAYAQQRNSLGQRQMLQALLLECSLGNASYMLHIGKKVPLEIYNSLAGSEDLPKYTDKGNEFSVESSSNRNELVINDMFSGWYVIIGMNFSYVKMQQVKMSLKLTKRFWGAQYANQTNNIRTS